MNGHPENQIYLCKCLSEANQKKPNEDNARHFVTPNWNTVNLMIHMSLVLLFWDKSFACPLFHQALPKYLQLDTERVQKRAVSCILHRVPYCEALKLAAWVY